MSWNWYGYPQPNGPSWPTQLAEMQAIWTANPRIWDPSGVLDHKILDVDIYPITSENVEDNASDENDTSHHQNMHYTMPEAQAIDDYDYDGEVINSEPRDSESSTIESLSSKGPQDENEEDDIGVATSVDADMHQQSSNDEENEGSSEDHSTHSDFASVVHEVDTEEEDSLNEYMDHESDSEFVLDDESEDGEEGPIVQPAPQSAPQPASGIYSDADSTHRLTDPTYVIDTAYLPTYIANLQKMWLKKSGDPNQTIDLPAGYVLMARPRLNANDGRVDRFLYGHPAHRRFDSVNQFYPHLVYLIGVANGTMAVSGNCQCKLCP